MKRLIFLLLLGLAPLLVSAQFITRTGVIYVGADTDTLAYIPMATPEVVDVFFNYKAFDDTDAILDLGEVHNLDSNTFDRVDDLRIPYTMDDSTWMVRFLDGFPAPFLGVKVTSSSVTALTPLFWTLIIYR